MARRQRTSARRHQAPRGRSGKSGLRGRPAKQSRDIDALTAQMERVVRELQVQLTRIGQIQAQLDRVAKRAEPPWEAPPRRSERTKH